MVQEKTVSSLDELLFQVDNSIEGTWETDVVPMLHDYLGEQVPHTKLFRVRQFSQYEDLKLRDYGKWQTLLLCSAEWQMAKVVAVHRTILKLSEVDVAQNTKLAIDLFSKSGISKQEYNIMFLLSGGLIKYFDHTFIKQVALAAQRGGMQATPLASKGTDGGERVYEAFTAGSKKSKLISYKSLFTQEYKRISHLMGTVADEIDKLVKSGIFTQTIVNYRHIYGNFLWHLSLTKQT